MGRSVQRYYIQGLAPSTQKTYHSAKLRFIKFCNSAAIIPTPLSEDTLCFYVSKLADQGLAHSTIKAYLSAARHLHISSGFPEPRLGDMPRLSQIMKGIKSHQAKQGRKPKPRLPITPAILQKIRKEIFKNPSFNNKMLWATCTLCFFGFLRSGEICVPSEQEYDAGAHLSFSDVAIDNFSSPSTMQVRIKASKTDPFRIGVDIYLGRASSGLCPISAMLQYLSVRGGESGPLFRSDDGKPLTRPRFVEELRGVLQAANVPSSHYSGHSFRIGAATTAAECGIPDSTIQLLGRWESSAYLLYVRTPREKLAAITDTLSLATPS